MSKAPCEEGQNEGRPSAPVEIKIIFPLSTTFHSAKLQGSGLSLRKKSEVDAGPGTEQRTCLMTAKHQHLRGGSEQGRQKDGRRSCFLSTISNFFLLGKEHTLLTCGLGSFLLCFSLCLSPLFATFAPTWHIHPKLVPTPGPLSLLLPLPESFHTQVILVILVATQIIFTETPPGLFLFSTSALLRYN